MSLWIRDQIPRLLFFTHLQVFSAICHSFSERSVGSSFNFVHCLIVDILVGGLKRCWFKLLQAGKDIGSQTSSVWTNAFHCEVLYKW